MPETVAEIASVTNEDPRKRAAIWSPPPVVSTRNEACAHLPRRTDARASSRTAHLYRHIKVRAAAHAFDLDYDVYFARRKQGHRRRLHSDCHFLSRYAS